MVRNSKRKKEKEKEIENNTISKIIERNPRLDKYFDGFREYLTAVATSSGYLNSLFASSEGGLGKTTITLNTLARLKTDYVYIANYSTVLAFVNFLYENRDKTIVCDDFEEAWKLGAKMFNILKGALWGIDKKNKRLVTYLTTSKLLKAPRQFEFKGKIIFLLNKMPNEKDPLVRALLSRGLTYKLDFTYDSIIEILEEFSNLPYKNLILKERKLIFDYLKSKTDKTSKNLNFRTLLKMYDLYIYDKNNWKSLVKILITRDEQLVLINKFVEECSTITEAQQKFCNETGLSRRQFFNIKSKII